MLLAPIGPMPSRERARVKVRVKPIAACHSRSAAVGPDHGFQRLPQLRCEADGAQALILRVIPSRSARRGAASRDASFHGRLGQRKSPPCAAGYDPTTTTLEARRRPPATAFQQRKAAVAWRDDGSLDRVDFRRDILPRLQRLPVGASLTPWVQASGTAQRCASAGSA